MVGVKLENQITKEKRIKLQSFVSLITNSSTEVFSTVDKSSIEGLYKMIDSILKVGGSTKRAKDILEIKIEFEDSLRDNYIDYVLDVIEEDEEFKNSNPIYLKLIE